MNDSGWEQCSLCELWIDIEHEVGFVTTTNGDVIHTHHLPSREHQ